MKRRGGGERMMRTDDLTSVAIRDRAIADSCRRMGVWVECSSE